MNKDELKKLSNDTFFDNDQGLINPGAHRVFNNAVIDYIQSESDKKANSQHNHTTNQIKDTDTKVIMTVDERLKLQGLPTGERILKLVFDGAFMRTGGDPYFTGTFNAINASVVGVAVGEYKIFHSLGHTNYIIVQGVVASKYTLKIFNKNKNDFRVGVYFNDVLADPSGQPVYFYILAY